MGAHTNIQYVDSTVNATSGCQGCQLWSPSVKTCYAGTLHETRLAKSLPLLYAPSFSDIRLIPGRMMKAANWKDLRGTDRPDKPWLNGKQRQIFVGDMGDTFSKDVPAEYIKSEVIAAIESKSGRRHFWLLFTKQIRRMLEFSEQLGGFPENVMAVLSVTDQFYADRDIPDLLKVKAKWRGISAEPLLSEIDLDGLAVGEYECFSCGYYGSDTDELDECGHCSYLYNPSGDDEHCPKCGSSNYLARCPQCQETDGQACGFGLSSEETKIDLIMLGGESGHNARPMQVSWARKIKDQCEVSGISFFMKQGSRANWPSYEDFDSFPEDLQVREYPAVESVAGSTSNLACRTTLD